MVYFVMGLIPNSSRHQIDSANATRRDLIELDTVENMNSGKTFDWFRIAARHFATARFVSEGDMDTFVHTEELLRSVYPSRGTCQARARDGYGCLSERNQ